MQCIKLVFLTAILSLSSASFLTGRQSSDTCNASNACISASGCTGTCAPVSSGGGPAVCQDKAQGRLVRLIPVRVVLLCNTSGGSMRKRLALTTVVMYIEE
ncbi:hypothetical protein DFJ43DRAFT_1042701 [Lentinula guzmanii]|uniref:Secreted protein n=1 Tax=Lentinula guzmanii TaxID=2804957 RepID=A0AA38JFL1_9AGAR|nr:hypothetical protein DFJ43DRAFT_1042701 [Lentinula guzmanii]